MKRKTNNNGCGFLFRNKFCKTFNGDLKALLTLHDSER
jgi:hypothetical protein